MSFIPNENSIKIKEEIKLNMISNKNHSFTVFFRNVVNYIQIKAFLQNTSNIEYEKIFYLNDLKKNKFLSICDSIDEMYKQIIVELGKKKEQKLKEENSQITIEIPVEHIKVKEMKFILYEKTKNEKEIIKELYNEYNDLKNENNHLKEEINNLKNVNKTINEKIELIINDNNQLNSKYNSLEEQIKIILKELNYAKKETEKAFNSSSIINDIKKQNVIIDWLKEKINKNFISFQLIFKMSENGSSSKDFHKFCDGKGDTLIIIKTNKNKIFGGFTPLNWTSNTFGIGLYDTSDKTFVFSLDLMKKYDMINKEKMAIYCKDIYGPIFGNYDIFLGKNMKIGSSYATKTPNFFSDNILELTGGMGENNEFEVEEMEVYKVVI